MQHIEINSEPIELFKFLKFSGLLASGGEAKVAIENSEILVNGEVETQKDILWRHRYVQWRNNKCESSLTSPTIAHVLQLFHKVLVHILHQNIKPNTKSNNSNR